MTTQSSLHPWLAGLGLLGTLASAATADVVVSNLANDSASAWTIGSTGATLEDSPNAIQFTTGPGPGWILESVTLVVGTTNDTTSGTIGLEIAADSNGLPGANLLDLQGPVPTTSFEMVTFLPPQEPFTLLPETTYWLVATADVADGFAWWYTTDTSASGLAGWSIGDDTYAGFPVGRWTVLESAVPPVGGPAPQLFRIDATALSEPTGACCLPDGTCELRTEGSCAFLDGFWQGAFTACEDFDCADPPGACCLPNGTCELRTEGSCAFLDGFWQGAFTACEDFDCADPPGACCLPNGTCELRTEGSCAFLDGFWQGAFTACEDFDCADPPGACCLPNGTCELRTEGSCGFLDGTWAGAFTQCADVTCPSCPADLNDDGIVDGADLGILLSQWGGPGTGDLNGSGTVDGADLGILLAAWGPCP